MSVVVVLAVLAIVIYLVMTPLRHGRVELEASVAAHDELEARKEAKYREIRDAELDYRTGKLSEADWREADRALRAEAIAILERLDKLI